MEANNQVTSSLNFNGQLIAVAKADGQNWIAIKPVCEALGVDYEGQRERIHRNPILSELPRKHRVVAGDNSKREMLCLPERYVYGWLFSIQSKSPELIAFQRECYDVLYDYFHGIMSQRKRILKEKRNAEERIAELEAKFEAQDEYKELQQLRKFKKQVPHTLSKLDKGLEEDQLELDL